MSKRHFTLIEILIVIAIIAILMTIAIAVGGTMMKQAENTACASMIQKVLAACEKFKVDFGAYPQELSSTTARDADRQEPREGASDTLDNANDLGRYLFKRIPGTNSAQGAPKRPDPSTWHGDYLDEGDFSDFYVKESTNAAGKTVYTILDYWQIKLIYWLCYKNGNSGTTADRKKKLTPEIWSKGGDNSANVNCLKLYAYPDLTKCRNGSNADHAKDDDNVGGNIDIMKK